MSPFTAAMYLSALVAMGAGVPDMPRSAPIHPEGAGRHRQRAPEPKDDGTIPAKKGVAHG